MPRKPRACLLQTKYLICWLEDKIFFNSEKLFNYIRVSHRGKFTECGRRERLWPTHCWLQGNVWNKESPIRLFRPRLRLGYNTTWWSSSRWLGVVTVLASCRQGNSWGSGEGYTAGVEQSVVWWWSRHPPLRASTRWRTEPPWIL